MDGRVIEIETGRLVLRTPAEADLGAYLAYRNEPRALATQRMPPQDEAEARRFLRAPSELPPDSCGWRMLGIKRKANLADGLIGEVGVKLDPEQPEGNVGWWLHPHHHGQGLATEAARALLHWCFASRRLHRVTAGCLADNHRSLRVMTRLGMRMETRSLQSRRLGDARHDEIGCALLRREWAGAED